MSATITEILDSNNKALSAGDSNVGFVPPFTIHGTASKNCLIFIWLNKKPLSVQPASTPEGKWTYKFTPETNELDVVAREVSFTGDSKGTFQATYK
ncbi:hypothetical protein [Pseudomonas urmiensis]|jgi:hypothetical protein|uniref:hypothetical protein n=1 Tax=Pseudomonas urmiensis TaxID=2745493 RepID=UPI0034D78BAC